MIFSEFSYPCDCCLCRLHDPGVGYSEPLSPSRSSSSAASGDVWLHGKCNPGVAIAGSKHVTAKVTWLLFNG